MPFKHEIAREVYEIWIWGLGGGGVLQFWGSRLPAERFCVEAELSAARHPTRSHYDPPSGNPDRTPHVSYSILATRVVSVVRPQSNCRRRFSPRPKQASVNWIPARVCIVSSTQTNVPIVPCIATSMSSLAVVSYLGGIAVGRSADTMRNHSKPFGFMPSFHSFQFPQMSLPDAVG